MIFGRLAQLAGQFERNRCGQFAEFQVGRNFQRNVLDFYFIFRPQHRANVLREPILQIQIHVE